ncbi:hypothetical protein BN903_97 [Halorubrum sp. AJ67]|nr:hypothetical protein BN903_97 [Halorubrum sp. AJ67]
MRTKHAAASTGRSERSERLKRAARRASPASESERDHERRSAERSEATVFRRYSRLGLRRCSWSKSEPVSFVYDHGWIDAPHQTDRSPRHGQYRKYANR